MIILEQYDLVLIFQIFSMRRYGYLCFEYLSIYFRIANPLKVEYLLFYYIFILRCFGELQSQMNKLLFALLLALAIIGTNAAYNTKLALELAYMSSIAYQTPASIDSWSCTRCKTYPLKNVKSFSNSVGDLQGFTGFSSNLNGIILAFRGSSNLQNWIINLSTNQIDYPKCTGCKVHNGFYTAWNNLAKPIVISHIQNLRSLYRDAKIYVTGHSLGGAIASLSVPDIKQTFGNIAGLITFGEPRIGNQAFSTYYASVSQCDRVVHYSDIVPHIPPAALNFYHQGNEVWYDKSMKTYKICPPQSNSCSNSLGSGNYGTSDHAMDLYLTLPGNFLDAVIKQLTQSLQIAKLKLKVRNPQLKIQRE